MPPPTPSTAPTRMPVGALSQSTTPFFDLKSILFFDRFSMPFWIDFGAVLGSNLRSCFAFLASKFGQVRSKTRLWKPINIKNVNFLENLQKPVKQQ